MVHWSAGYAHCAALDNLDELEQKNQAIAARDALLESILSLPMAFLFGYQKTWQQLKSAEMREQGEVEDANNL